MPQATFSAKPEGSVGRYRQPAALRERRQGRGRAWAAAVTAAIACVTHAGAAETLRFSVPEGPVLNEFYRQGPVAAHLVLTPGRTPRLIVAFPAGNSGAAVWFECGRAALFEMNLRA